MRAYIAIALVFGSVIVHVVLCRIDFLPALDLASYKHSPRKTQQTTLLVHVSSLDAKLTNSECTVNLLNAQVRADLYCVTHRRFNDIGGLQLVEDDAGLKHLRFQTTSLAGTSEWTDPIVFYPHVIIEPTGGATTINIEQ